MAQAISNVVLYLSNPVSPGTLYKLKLEPVEKFFDIDDLLIDKVVCSRCTGVWRDLVGLSIHAGTEYPQKGKDPYPHDAPGTANGEGVFFFLGQGGSPVAPVVIGGGSGTQNWTVDDYRPPGRGYEPNELPDSFVEAALSLGFSAARLAASSNRTLTVFNNINGVWSDLDGSACTVCSTAATPALCEDCSVVAHRLHVGASRVYCVMSFVMCEHLQ